MNVIINPGTGPIDGAQGHQAGLNMIVFVQDVADIARCSPVEFHVANLNRDERGRFAFQLSRTVRGVRRSVVVDMPGIAIERVRWMRLPEQNIWDFPRLYVDGSSWVWFYAIDRAAERLSEEGEP